MKTHDLAAQLELLARLLRTLPNNEVEKTFSLPFQGALFSQQDLSAAALRKESLPPGIEDHLKGMTPAEIENLLDAGEQQFSTSQLLELAERLNVGTSKRQSRAALVNLIVRHFETAQMDSIIRGSKRDES